VQVVTIILFQAESVVLKSFATWLESCPSNGLYSTIYSITIIIIKNSIVQLIWLAKLGHLLPERHTPLEVTQLVKIPTLYYTLVNHLLGSAVLVCEADETWNYSPPVCIENRCPSLTPSTGVEGSVGSYLHGTSPTLTCAAGYHVISPSTLM